MEGEILRERGVEREMQRKQYVDVVSEKQRNRGDTRDGKRGR